MRADKSACDRLFSKIVRRVGECEACGKFPPEVQLQCAHWISRRYSNTRCDLDNAFCLCAGCHIYYTANPTEWGRWAVARRGEDTYQRLLRAAHSTTKVNWKALRGELAAM